MLFHSTHSWLPLTENWILNQIKAIKGFQQHVLADSETENPPDFASVHIKPKTKNSVLARFQSVEKWRQNVTDQFNGEKILLSHFGNTGWENRKIKVHKHVTRFYGYDLLRLPQQEPKWKARYRELFSTCNAFITEGPHMAGLLARSGCNPSKIHVAPLGTWVNEIEWKQRKILNTEINILLGMSFREKKGIPYAIEAAGIFKKQKPDLKINLHLIGDANAAYAPNLQEKEIILQKIKEHNLGPITKMYGFVDYEKFLQIARLCHFTIQPSIWAKDGDCEGGYPVSFVDCMATGLPVISTNHCDIPFVVNRQNGFICPEKDVDALVASMEEIIKPGILEEKSLAARKTVEEKFDWRVLGENLSAILHNL